MVELASCGGDVVVVFAQTVSACPHIEAVGTGCNDATEIVAEEALERVAVLEVLHTG